MSVSALEQRLVASWPPEAWADVTTLVALSGGGDSTALLRALVAVRRPGPGTLLAAHFNHRWRGVAADDDERFVVELCRRQGISCHVERRGEPGATSESAARDERYAFLQRTAERLGARYVVTAHTADDQAETILHRIVRGTGLTGLSGMRRARPLGPAVSLVRPWLTVRRTEIVAYLNELGQGYCHDATNAEPRFTRARLRHELLPHLAAEYNPHVVEALLRLGTQAAEATSLIEALVADLAERCLRTSVGEATIDVRCLTGQPRYVLRELGVHVWRGQGWPLGPMGFREWDDLAARFEQSRAGQPSAPTMFPSAIRLTADARQLVLTRC